MSRRGFARLHVASRDEWQPRQDGEVVIIENGVHHVYRVDRDDWAAFTAWAAGAHTAAEPEQAEKVLHICAAAEWPYIDLDTEPAVCRFFQNQENRTVYVNDHGVIVLLDGPAAWPVFEVLSEIPAGYERISMSHADELHHPWMDEITQEKP